jgi:hypothetical protein
MVFMGSLSAAYGITIIVPAATGHAPSGGVAVWELPMMSGLTDCSVHGGASP